MSNTPEFKWTDADVIAFANDYLNKRVNFAILHDYAAVPVPIQLALKEFKSQHSSSGRAFEILEGIHEAGG